MIIEMRNYECDTLSLDKLVDKDNIINKIGVPTFMYIAEVGRKRMYIYNIDRGIIYDVTMLPLKYLDGNLCVDMI